ncbi:MAG: hypothetical protein RLZZ435_2395 [Cyanobacteriota bacterium]|jgi:septation ring formation regulator EzrA
MTQALDPTVAALQESVRHNEKNIDRLDRHLQAFRAEVLQQFAKVDDRFVQMEQKMDDRFQKVDDRFVQMKQNLNNRFEQLDSSIKQINTTLLMLSGFLISVGIVLGALKGVF